MTLALQKQESGIYRHIAVPSRHVHQVRAVPHYITSYPQVALGGRRREAGTMAHPCPLLAFWGAGGTLGDLPWRAGGVQVCVWVLGCSGTVGAGQPQGSSHRRKWGSGGPGGLGGLCRGLEGATAQQERGGISVWEDIGRQVPEGGRQMHPTQLDHPSWGHLTGVPLQSQRGRDAGPRPAPSQPLPVGWHF